MLPLHQFSVSSPRFGRRDDDIPPVRTVPEALRLAPASCFSVTTPQLAPKAHPLLTFDNYIQGTSFFLQDAENRQAFLAAYEKTNHLLNQLIAREDGGFKPLLDTLTDKGYQIRCFVNLDESEDVNQPKVSRFPKKSIDLLIPANRPIRFVESAISNQVQNGLAEVIDKELGDHYLRGFMTTPVSSGEPFTTVVAAEENKAHLRNKTPKEIFMREVKSVLFDRPDAYTHFPKVKAFIQETLAPYRMAPAIAPEATAAAD